ncbi:MAG: methylmalonyl Co-A mutase-associated GTPase MeaB [Bernardetiaceae bacterium]|jgi:LAO/AO transport system kinase|nr:methylmalonyl Co-A mutase-associated GTPase MeaB [Bernardetiaceae bacterium]
MTNPSRPGRLLPEQYVAGILARDRYVLSRAITLVESQLPFDQALAAQVIDAVLPHTGGSIRLGITGVPGVGKSTFIEAFGHLVVNQGHRLAVLAVDPTSQVSGGSILGDKTRMETLSHRPEVYIRPSPAGSSLGGVSRKTREALLLCEAAGFDVVVVETVGVGQSETAVSQMTDFFLLLMLAGAGDELQGIKKGIMEMADAVAINKADGENQAKAKTARVEYQNALHLFPPAPTGWQPPVLTCSATTGLGLPQIWETVQQHRQQLTANGWLARKRQTQNLAWMHDLIRQRLEEQFYQHPAVQQLLPGHRQAVAQGQMHAASAAQALLRAFANLK